LSDEDVDEVRGGVEEVRAARGEVFMLFYELLDGGEDGGEAVKEVKGKGRVVRSSGLSLGGGGSTEGSRSGSVRVDSPSSPPSSPPTSSCSPTVEELLPPPSMDSQVPVEKEEEDHAAGADEVGSNASVVEDESSSRTKKKTKKKKKKSISESILPEEG